MVVVVVGQLAAVLVQSATGSHVGLAADDRFHPGVFRFAIELDRAEHVAMIGDGDGRLTERFDLLDQRIDLIRSVKKAELGVQVKVNELGCHAA
jgi:hypothetical protein